MAAIRARVLTLDRNLPVQHLETMEKSLGASLARRRFSTLLLTAFALLAMLLAAIGIYGLFSYWVAMRENEIAVRLALGARPSIILRWVGLRALRLAAAGIALGLIGAWIAARGLEDVGLRNRAAQSRDHARGRPCRRRHRDRRHRPACLARRAHRRGPPPALRLIAPLLTARIISSNFALYSKHLVIGSFCRCGVFL